MGKSNRFAKRASIYASAPVGVPNHSTLPTPQPGEPYATHQLVVRNFGKTVGFITKIEWGFYYRDLPPGVDIWRVSDVIDKKKIPVAGGGEFSCPNVVVAPGGEPVGFYQVRFPWQQWLGHVLYGRITYKDEFGDTRLSTFRFVVFNGVYQSVGDFDEGFDTPIAIPNPPVLQPFNP